MADIALRTDVHEPSDACAAVHCWGHDVDEDSEGAWRVCFECKHAYRSPDELQREWVANAPPDLPDRETPPPVERIYFCPLCMHDW